MEVTHGGSSNFNTCIFFKQVLVFRGVALEVTNYRVVLFFIGLEAYLTVISEYAFNVTIHSDSLFDVMRLGLIIG